jgi:hypothetical protein
MINNPLSLFNLSPRPHQQTQEKTNIPKEYIAIAAAFIILVSMLSGLGTGTLCSLIGFVFPAYKSIKAMETHATSEVTQWLVYWVVYAFFSVIEIFSTTLVYWIPFYYRFKLGFLLWAMLVSRLMNLWPNFANFYLMSTLHLSLKHAEQNICMTTF